MKILLTNDDGINSPGLEAIEKELLKKHQVVVVAPNGERSGYSNSITFNRYVQIKKIDNNHYSCSGTPADCVQRVLSNFFPDFFPDIVVSGINIGANLGTDILYSGTCGAARQAAIMGVPGVAVSLTSFKEPFFFEKAAAFTLEYLETFYSGWDKKHFININVPNNNDDSHKIAVASPAKRYYREKVEPVEMGNLEVLDTIMKFFGTFHDKKKMTDAMVVEDGYISVTPVIVQPVQSKKMAKQYKKYFDKTVFSINK